MNIKKHVEERGLEQIDISVHLCKFWWRTFNDDVFTIEGEPLTSIPEFVIKKHMWDGTLGAFTGRKQKPHLIEINSKIQYRETFLTVLIHEMVHQWQEEYGFGNRAHHGKHFFKWKNPIYETTGLTLSILTDDFKHG